MSGVPSGRLQRHAAVYKHAPLFALLFLAHAALADVSIPASRVEQSGKPGEGAAQPGFVVFSNEPGDARAGVYFDFDLASVSEKQTPLARLQFNDVVKLKVKRPGQKAATERGIFHVFTGEGKEPVGVLPVKAGGFVNSYTIDVTPAINAALAATAEQKRIRLEVRLEGKPLAYEVYGLPDGEGIKPPTLEIAPISGWSDDWEQRVAPIGTAPIVHAEPCLALTKMRGEEVALRLLYPAKKITAVFANATGEKLEEGRDWVLREGKLILPAGSRAPIQQESEFFSIERKGKDGAVTTGPTTVRLMSGAWYHQRQMVVNYEPADREWNWPAPISSIAQLPRLKQRLADKSPVRIVLFGDSIAAGGDSSSLSGCWPYQPAFGELVARKLRQHYGAPITFLNHSRAGATSTYGLGQAEAQVGAFKPDLAIIAYGMNDRAPERRVLCRENLEKIIDAIRSVSPETECLIVTPMLNNPKQPTGLDPVIFIRDEALKTARPAIAFADVTSAHLELVKHKEYLDLSGNGANHPNDFLHRIYAQRILEVLIPR